VRDAVERRAARRSPRLRRASVVTTEYRKSAPTTLSLCGCNLVRLTTDATRDDARRFYETLGFRTTHVGMKFLLDD
jgi:hypothetical protein